MIFTPQKSTYSKGPFKTWCKTSHITLIWKSNKTYTFRDNSPNNISPHLKWIAKHQSPEIAGCLYLQTAGPVQISIEKFQIPCSRPVLPIKYYLAGTNDLLKITYNWWSSIIHQRRAIAIEMEDFYGHCIQFTLANISTTEYYNHDNVTHKKSLTTQGWEKLNKSNRKNTLFAQRGTACIALYWQESFPIFRQNNDLRIIPFIWNWKK